MEVLKGLGFGVWFLFFVIVFTVPLVWTYLVVFSASLGWKHGQSKRGAIMVPDKNHYPKQGQ